MKKFSKSMAKGFVYAAAIMAPMVWCAESFAGSVALTLVRSTLKNVTDTAGTWQHEWGTMTKGTTTVGQYAIYRRVTTGGTGGTTTQNTAMVTMELFFSVPAPAAGYPPQNITLQGAHSYSSGRFAGSVSAASNRYNWIQGADATSYMSGSNSILTIIWEGANQLTLP